MGECWCSSPGAGESLLHLHCEEDWRRQPGQAWPGLGGEGGEPLGHTWSRRALRPERDHARRLYPGSRLPRGRRAWAEGGWRGKEGGRRRQRDGERGRWEAREEEVE